MQPTAESDTGADKRVFRKGFIPDADHMPAERTHARAKLIYNTLRALVLMSKAKREAGLREIKDRNAVLYDRVTCYLAKLTPEDIQFFKGPRPWFHPDGTLAIYDPVRDNPVLMSVFRGEQPTDSSLWVPGQDGHRPAGPGTGLVTY